MSESTKRDTEHLFGAGNNLRYVTPLGVDELYFMNLPAARIEDVRARLNVHPPYILFVGTIEPRKNLLRLIRAFEKIAERHLDLSLVIAGGRGWNCEETLQALERSTVNARIRRLGYISEEDKLALTMGCSLLAYPSLYEGFGLPVLEGMAVGVPVVTSNVSSLPEVAGDAAILVDPTSVDKIAAAMDSVLSDNGCNALLRQRGPKQAKNFSWGRTAELTYGAYHRVGKR